MSTPRFIHLGATRPAATVALLLAAWCLGGCGGSDSAAPSPGTGQTGTGTAATSETPPGDVEPAPARRAWSSLVAESKTPTRAVAFARPLEGSRRKVIRRKRFNNGPLSFLVVSTRPGWVKVYLPTRPNRSTGWLRASRVRVLSNNYSVRVNLRTRMLEARHRGVPFVRTKVAVGTRKTPTPRGTFYVTNVVRVRPPDGWFGPFALGISAHSPTLDSFNGQEPQIALHGTNRPDLLGRAVSNGCVRMPNAAVKKLARRLPPGTPVIVS